jgi:tetratricopeptide (TPR) repeat protein
LLVLYIISFLIYVLAFFINTRYRLPLVPVLLMFVGGFMAVPFERKLSASRIAGGVTAGIMVFLVSMAPLSWIPEGARISGEHYNLAMIYLRGADLEKAREEFKAELEKVPFDGKTHAWLGYVESKLGNPEYAKQHFLEATELSPQSSEVQALYGMFLFETGHQSEAEEALRRSLALNPGEILPAYFLADILYRSGRSGEAIDIIGNVQPDESNALAVHQLRGVIQLDLGLAGQAAASLTEALEYDAENTRTLFYLGLALKGTGSYDEALGAFSEVAKREPGYPGLQLAMGDCLYAQGEFVGARDAYTQGLEVEPESFELHHNLGLAFMRLGDADAARGALTEAIELKPDYYQAYYNLGNLYLAEGNADVAIESFEKAIEIKPDFAPALLNLGTLYAQLGDYDSAREYWQRVVTCAPGTNEGAIAGKNLKALEEG